MAEITQTQLDALLDARSHIDIGNAFVSSITTTQFWDRARAIEALNHLEQAMRILKGLV